LKVVVHVGSHSLPDARELAAHAQEIGAAAVSALAPGYFKPAGVDDLVDFCAAVAAAAPKLPFYYYHIPSMTGVTLSAADVLRRGAARIPTLAGVKFTHNDLMMLQECLAVVGVGGGNRNGGVGDGRPDVVYGSDETLLAGLAFGLGGAVGSTYNYAAPVYHELMKAFAAGDLSAARRAQAKSVALVRVLMDFGVARTGKAIMEMIGVDCGPVRAPLRPLGLEERYAVYDRLKPLDIFPRPLRRP
jgi:N-acetylneuraminate lyase